MNIEYGYDFDGTPIKSVTISLDDDEAIVKMIAELEASGVFDDDE